MGTIIIIINHGRPLTKRTLGRTGMRWQDNLSKDASFENIDDWEMAHRIEVAGVRLNY